MGTLQERSRAGHGPAEAPGQDARAPQEGRASLRQTCSRLVMVRLRNRDRQWVWHWVCDLGAGGLCVNFLTVPPEEDAIHTTLLDVDEVRFLEVVLQPIWHEDGHVSRTGFSFSEVSPDLARWLAQAPECPPAAGDE